MNEYILVIFTENQVGVLNRITACYLRRKINIESLKVSESSIRGISMFVISAFMPEEIANKLAGQIGKIVEVIDVACYTPDELITQEIALYKVSTKALGGGRVDMLSRQWNARLIEISPSFVVVEKSGAHEEINEMRSALEEQNALLDFTRSGSVVLHRESIEEGLRCKLES
jgi:acetolactate synthase-1/3 small subunit